eukprot:CAMPEP_0118942546 /NCGR_PEP_ID=MMETSP1169-20130426/36378_1 /TAXON_ID=36882 /ORGANISM="Pyramimonas obovata, Strain CCMP722" /LENGTH=295 /DNA_ID=CAMNT_0006887577 /DNA_START=375 /DNA_END=1258 /DNA_ORIENTATION=+
MGQTWSETSTGQGVEVTWEGVSVPERCPDSSCNVYDTVYVVGSSGMIMRSTDFGSTWTRLNNFTFSDTFYTTRIDSIVLHSVMGVSQTSNVFVVGDLGLILHTSDAGATWTQQQSETTQTLYDVYFLSDVAGYAVGAFGTILRTSNMGATWIKLTSGFEGASSQTNLYGVKAYWSSKTPNAATESYAMAVGDNGIVTASTNQGANWIQKPTCTANTLYDVHFSVAVTSSGADTLLSELLDGYVVGKEGVFCLTTNQASSWSTITTGTLNDLYSLAGYQGDRPMAFGAAGVSMHYV